MSVRLDIESRNQTMLNVLHENWQAIWHVSKYRKLWFMKSYCRCAICNLVELVTSPAYLALSDPYWAHSEEDDEPLPCFPGDSLKTGSNPAVAQVSGDDNFHTERYIRNVDVRIDVMLMTADDILKGNFGVPTDKNDDTATALGISLMSAEVVQSLYEMNALEDIEEIATLAQFSVEALLCPISACSAPVSHCSAFAHMLRAHTDLLCHEVTYRDCAYFKLNPAKLQLGQTFCLGLMAYCGTDPIGCNRPGERGLCCRHENMPPFRERLESHLPIMVMASMLDYSALGNFTCDGKELGQSAATPVKDDSDVCAEPPIVKRSLPSLRMESGQAGADEEKSLDAYVTPSAPALDSIAATGTKADLVNPNPADLASSNPADFGSTIEEIYDIMTESIRPHLQQLRLLSLKVTDIEKKVYAFGLASPQGTVSTNTDMDCAEKQMLLIYEYISMAIKPQMTKIVNQIEHIYDILLDSIKSQVEKFMTQPLEVQVDKVYDTILECIKPQLDQIVELSAVIIEIEKRVDRYMLESEANQKQRQVQLAKAASFAGDICPAEEQKKAAEEDEEGEEEVPPPAGVDKQECGDALTAGWEMDTGGSKVTEDKGNNILVLWLVAAGTTRPVRCIINAYGNDSKMPVTRNLEAHGLADGYDPMQFPSQHPEWLWISAEEQCKLIGGSGTPLINVEIMVTHIGNS